MCRGQVVHKKSLYRPLNFAVNLKLLLKNEIFFLILEDTRKMVE